MLRLRYTLRTFGHTNVAVLDGGFPAWLAAGYDVETSAPVDPTGAIVGSQWTKDRESVWALADVVSNAGDGTPTPVQVAAHVYALRQSVHLSICVRV